MFAQWNFITNDMILTFHGQNVKRSMMEFKIWNSKYIYIYISWNNIIYEECI